MAVLFDGRSVTERNVEFRKQEFGICSLSGLSS
jgi:hypothetical protein